MIYFDQNIFKNTFYIYNLLFKLMYYKLFVCISLNMIKKFKIYIN